MNGRYGTQRPGFGSGIGGPTPIDIWVLLAVVFATFSFLFLPPIAWLPQLLRLTPAVWQRGYLWQLLTYSAVGTGQPGIWFLLELFILFIFSRQVFERLGRLQFWKLLAWVAGLAAVCASAAEIGLRLVMSSAGATTLFPLMQGQRMLLAILIAAFATLHGNATIYLFFVLPIRARWFLGLEILFAFMGFLGTGDFSGFVGLCTAVGLTFLILSPNSIGRNMRDLWLRMKATWLKASLSRSRKRRGLHIVRDEEDDPPDRWVH